MRVVVYGRENTLEKLTAALQEEGIEAVGILDGLYEILGWKTKYNFDFAIVDGHARNPGETCERIRKYWNIPVVMMVNQSQANWKDLLTMDIDGYLSEGVEGTELTARLRAIIRRFWFTGKLKEMNPMTWRKGFLSTLNIN